MWGRIKQKVSRSRDSAPATTYDEQQDSVGDDVTLAGFNRLSLSNSSDFMYNSHHCSSDAGQTQAVADEVACTSSMVHGFSNHSYDSLKIQQQINGNHFLSNCVNSDSGMLFRFQTSVSEQERMANSCVGFPQNDNGINVKYSDFARYSHLENYNGYAADNNCKLESDIRQVVEEIPKTFVSEPRQHVCSSPPKLMRREKIKTGEVAESRRSRLLCRPKSNRESATSLPKPLELPPRLRSSSSLTPDDIQTDEVSFEARISSTAVCKKPNVMSGSSSASDCRMSTEPSTAESIDSGIQPSLCSGNEDRGMNSSGVEDDPQDDLFPERFTSQNSDYMLLEDAKAMMASSLPTGGSCTDYVDHFVVETPPNTHRSTRSDVGTNHTQQIPVDYVPYCESVTVLRRINRDPLDENEVRQTSYDSKADYVPVDGSFAALYNGHLFTAMQSDTNARVTRGTGPDSDDSGRGAHLQINQLVSDYSSKLQRSLNGSSGVSVECNQVNRTGNMQIQSQPVGFDVDSDDDSYLPPLPTRNYRNTSQRCVEDLPASSDTVPGHASLETNSEEKTHMSWEEVMKEAHALGIPLSAPRSEVSDWKSSVSVASSDMSDCTDNPSPYSQFDRMSSSEHSAVASSLTLQDKDISNTSQNNSPSKTSALAKCASPFKEKFRLQNLFSKKKSKKTDVIDFDSDGAKGSSRIVQRHSSAAAEIQRRNLPPLPPKRSQAAGSNMSRSSLDPIPPSSEFPRQRAHRTMSTLTLPARDSASASMTGSVWAGSSASVGSQSEVSETGISSRSVSGIESHRDVPTQGKFASFYVHFIEFPGRFADKPVHR